MLLTTCSESPSIPGDPSPVTDTDFRMEQQNIYSNIIEITKQKSNGTSKEFLKIFESIGSAVLYGLCSTSMVFANKAVITTYNFDFPFFIMACQMALCILFLHILKKMDVAVIQTYSIKLAKSYASPALFYALHSVTALYALGGMSIPMYAAIKRCAPIATLVLSVIILKQKIPSTKVILSVVLISVGCLLASLGDLQFDSRAYGYGALSILAQSLYLTLSQQSLEKLSTLDVLYLNSCNTLPFFIIVCLLAEIRGLTLYKTYTDIGFVLCFGIQICLGVVLNYSLFLCTAKNSALTTSVVGVFKSICQTVIGFFTFGGIKINFLNVFGITMNTTGGILYVYSKNKRFKTDTCINNNTV